MKIYFPLENACNRQSLVFITLFLVPNPADPSLYLYSRKYPDFPDAARGRYSRTPRYVAEHTGRTQLAGGAERRHRYLAWSLQARPCLCLSFGQETQTRDPSITLSESRTKQGDVWEEV